METRATFNASSNSYTLNGTKIWSEFSLHSHSPLFHSISLFPSPHPFLSSTFYPPLSSLFSPLFPRSVCLPVLMFMQLKSLSILLLDLNQISPYIFFSLSLLSPLSSLLSVQQPPPQTDVHHSALLQYHTTQPQQPNQPVPLIPTQKPITQGVLPPQQLVHGATAATPTQLLPGSTGTGLGAQLPPPSLLTLPHQQQLYSTNQQVGRGEEFKGLTYYGIKRVN